MIIIINRMLEDVVSLTESDDKSKGSAPSFLRAPKSFKKIFT